MNNNWKTFWIPGVVSVILMGAFTAAHPRLGIVLLDDLLSKPGAPGAITAIVMIFTVWVSLSLALRYRASVSGDTNLKATVARRLATALRLGGRGSFERSVALLSGQSGIEASETASAYGPLRALIWSLPAFGFLGTAFEMRNSVSGLAEAMARAKDYEDLLQALAQGVVPHLADAFGITLFALGCSVFCFVLLSLVYSREESVLNKADTQVLAMLGAMSGPSENGVTTDSALAHQVETLNEILNDGLVVVRRSQLRDRQGGGSL